MAPGVFTAVAGVQRDDDAVGRCVAAAGLARAVGRPGAAAAGRPGGVALGRAVGVLGNQVAQRVGARFGGGRRAGLWWRLLWARALRGAVIPHALGNQGLSGAGWQGTGRTPAGAGRRPWAAG